MPNTILFDFESHEIRFVGTAENPEWIAADICDALDIVNTSDALTTLKPSEKGIANVDDGTLTGSQMLTVNEPGLYRLIFKSRKAAAERMKDWVFSVVLPSIRKTGSYAIAPEIPVPKPLVIEQSKVVAQNIVDIQQLLSGSNPRLAQLLIDIGVNDFAESHQPKLTASHEFPEDKWYGLVQIANKMGITTNESTRVKLGQYISNAIKSCELNVERVREERLCNGQQQEIWCYRDNDAIRSAIQSWKEQVN
jgi:prophage antirepressor-like protein